MSALAWLARSARLVRQGDLLRRLQAISQGTLAIMNPVWFKRPEDKDYIAARTYLSLVASDDVAKVIARKLKRASTDVVKYRANDILRSSRLMVNEWDEVMVQHDIEKVRTGQPLSPVLLVTIRDNFETPLIIADGFHRVLTCHRIDPKYEVPCVHVTVNL